MNKNKIKIFAVNAREEIIKKIKQKSNFYKIKDDKSAENELGNTDINGKMLSDKEMKLRNELVEKIKKDGYENTVEEIAYTWFNRIMAIMYMDKNKFFPSFIPKYITIFELEDNNELKILRDPLEIAEELELNQEEIINDYQSNQKAEIFKKIIIKICNEMNKYIPVMFEKIEDYTELLFPETIITDIIPKMISEIDETDWEEIEIIGWMYQFYISDKKDILMGQNKKYDKEEIPAVTQLFTPKWIVKYMVENSLGKIWIENKENSELKNNMRYYIEEAQQEESVKNIVENIKYKNIKPEEIKFLDPCCGSGHILVTAFDLFYDIYLETGEISSEIPEKILKNNLFGIDIDKRAVQLSTFALTMKAREKSRNIFTKTIQPNIVEIIESNEITEEDIKVLTEKMNDIEKEKTENLIKKYYDSKEYGSLIEAEENEYNFIFENIEKISKDIFKTTKIEKIKPILNEVIKQNEILKIKYDVVCTNPPYMGTKGMNDTLKKYLEKNYKDSKTDLFSVFIERNFKFLKENGFNSMVTMQSWMFLSSFEKMRKDIIEQKTITSLIHLGARAFEEIGGEVVQTTTFVIRNKNIINYKGKYVRLSEIKIPYEKEKEFFNEENRFTAKSGDFEKIPGSPIAYWVSEKVRDIFENSKKLGEIGSAQQGLATADNNRFLRLWHEVELKNIGFGMKSSEEAQESGLKWFPYNKGGSFRKWYGNNDYLINWNNDGYEIKHFKKSVIRNPNYYFKKGLTWSDVSSGDFSIRFSNKGFIFDTAGPTFFSNENTFNIIGLMNSVFTKNILKIITPTIHFSNGVIINLPIIFPKEESIKNKIDDIVQENIDISKTDWDNFETSWDFEVHPLLKYRNNENTIEKSFENWKNFAEDNFNKLWKNEEELNKIFLEIYDLSDEMSPEVEEKDVTVRKADLERDIKSFISYGVGCIMGRYSPDKPGLIFAGGDFDFESYSEFKPDKDGIIPITENNYFEDDLTNRFVELVKYIYGKESLEENLGFIAKVLNEKYEDSRETIRNYFYKEFYKDHCRTYQKKPIYWMFNSGKNGAFKAIVYLHRYNRETIGTLRNEYLLELQSMYNFSVEEMNKQISEDTNLDKKDLKKMQKDIVKLNDYIEEIRKYDEKVHHYADLKIELDLDDGVSVNYKKFMKNDEELLEKI